MKDVAQRAGVSISTASIVLRNAPGVDAFSPRVRRSVADAARLLGYSPHPIASSLRSKRTQTVGFLVSGVQGSYSGALATSAQTVLEPQGYHVLLSSTDRTGQDEAWITQFCRRVDGILLYVFGSQSQVRSALRVVERVSVPVVVVGGRVEGVTATRVSLDNQAGAQAAVAHLASLGHRKIGYLGGQQDAPTNVARRQGWLAGLRAAGVSPRRSWARELVSDSTVGEQMTQAAENARALLDPAEGVTAIFCFSDLLAAMLCRVALDMGRRTPQDLSIVGFDNLSWTALYNPPLTTVTQPLDEMGRAAGQALLDELARRDSAGPDSAPGREIVIQPQLIVRESTAAPAKENLA